MPLYQDVKRTLGQFQWSCYADCKRCALAEYFNQPGNMDDVKMNIDITFTKNLP